MDKIKILVADDMEETRMVIKKILNLEDNIFEVVGEASNGEEVLSLIPKIKPDVVLMDINMPILNGLEATEKITNQYPLVIVIMMSVQAENHYLKKAMFHGAKEYIIKPFNYKSLTETIKRTYEKNKERQMQLVKSEQRDRKGKIMSFYSSKKGVGKSVLALNTAVILSKDKNKKILLLDMDVQVGSVTILVNQYNQNTTLNAADTAKLDSYENIEPYLYKYSENLDMFFAYGKTEEGVSTTKDNTRKIMKLLKREYDIIIVDAGTHFNDHTLYLLDDAEKIFFVSTMDIESLKNTKLGMRKMQLLGYDKNKVKLVINRFTTNYGISKKDVEKVFKDGIFATIPEEEKTVTISINKGIPFCETAKYNEKKIGKALEQMCKDLSK